MIELIFYCALISCYVHVHLNYGPELLYFFSFFETINYAAICYLCSKKILSNHGLIRLKKFISQIPDKLCN